MINSTEYITKKTQKVKLRIEKDRTDNALRRLVDELEEIYKLELKFVFIRKEKTGEVDNSIELMRYFCEVQIPEMNGLSTGITKDNALKRYNFRIMNGGHLFASEKSYHEDEIDYFELSHNNWNYGNPLGWQNYEEFKNNFCNRYYPQTLIGNLAAQNGSLINYLRIGGIDDISHARFDIKLGKQPRPKPNLIKRIFDPITQVIIPSGRVK